jgi:hypothetical protein
MSKRLIDSKQELYRCGKKIIVTSCTATVWIAINCLSLPIQAQSDYEGLGRLGTRIWGERSCDIKGITSQEEITKFLDHCAPWYTHEEQAYLDMKSESAIGLLFFFFFDLGVFQRPSPSVVRRVTDYIDEGISTTGTYRGRNGTRTIAVERRSGQVAITDVKTGETRIVNSRTGQLVDDVDGTIANRNTREGEPSARQNNRGNPTEEPCLSYAPISTSKNLIAKLYPWLSIQIAKTPCRNGNSRQATQERVTLRYKLNANDLDWRGRAKTESEAYQLYQEALKEAFKRTGVPEEQFKITKWAEDGNGKTRPVEWRADRYSRAEVNADNPHDGYKGPDAPHVGWQTPGNKAVKGHIILDFVPAGRPELVRPTFRP